MADVLITGVWNRVMISDLGFQATPVALLASLRYFLAPISIWAGKMSDRHAIFGYPRLFWVWLGRTMMALSMVLLGLLTASIARGGDAGLAVWGGITGSMLLFSLGNAFSGSTFLALVYDRAPEHQRGRAVGIVWTFLLTGFAVGGAFFALLLPASEDPATGLSFTPATLQNLFLIAAFVVSGLWFASLLGEEQRISQAQRQIDDPEAADDTSLRQDLSTVWSNRSLRMFLGYLALSMAFAFSQDAILEPFAADVFGMSAETTTRFAAYWGTTAILGSIGFIILSRRFKSLNNTVMSQLGVIVIFGTFVLYTLAALTGMSAAIMPGLFTLGLGLGMWNIGTLGLMMEMSPDGRAGTFLGFWTLVVTLSRGFGISVGGIMHDGMYLVTGNEPVSYGVVFGIAAIGLVVAYVFLISINANALRVPREEVDTAQMIGAGLD
jgi:BCD family chlorophyll transporter-like MFS transporter